MDQDIAKRAETISKSARLARRIPRSSRACGKNLEESCQIFKQKSRDDFEVLKNLQRFSENLQRFSENLQRFSEKLQRFSEKLQRNEPTTPFYSLTSNV